jgi:glycosyltransferase involved in cell wall biosynthesis
MHRVLMAATWVLVLCPLEGWPLRHGSHAWLGRTGMAIRVAMLAELPEPGEPNHGGVQAVTSYLVPALAASPDVELHVIRFRSGVSKYRCHDQGRYQRHILPIGHLGTATNFLQDQHALNRCLASIRPDIVHSQGAGHYGILASRTRYPVVVTVHGILSEEVKFEPSLRLRARAAVQARLSDRICIRGARHTILISEYVARHYGDALGGKKYHVPNPVDERFFRIRRKDAGITILYAGRVRKLKGVTDLLQAVARMPSRDHVRVVLAGSLGESGYVAELREACVRLGIEHQVELPGLLDPEQLVRALAECACLVLPSYQENAPMVVQEAMAAGVPVVATRIGGIPFQVAEGTTGFLYAPGDITALAGHLEQLIASAVLREQFGNAARSIAASRYQASSVAEKTVEVYRQVLEASGGVRRETA